jgi:hypothetical protein
VSIERVGVNVYLNAQGKAATYDCPRRWARPRMTSAMAVSAVRSLPEVALFSAPCRGGAGEDNGGLDKGSGRLAFQGFIQIKKDSRRSDDSLEERHWCHATVEAGVA